MTQNKGAAVIEAPEAAALPEASESSVNKCQVIYTSSTDETSPPIQDNGAAEIEVPQAAPLPVASSSLQQSTIISSSPSNNSPPSLGSTDGSVVHSASTSVLVEDLPGPLPDVPPSAPAETFQTRSSCYPFDCTALLELLKQSEEGKEIITRAQTGELAEAKQLQLAGIVAKYHLIHREKLRAEDLQTYALAICTLFKSERQVNNNKKN